jgi:twitching motility protein PilT
MDRLLAAASKADASALYLKPGGPPVVRSHGRLETMRLPELTSTGIEALAREIMGDEEEKTLAKFSATVFVHDLPKIGRFRISVYRRPAGFLLTARYLRED